MSKNNIYLETGNVGYTRHKTKTNKTTKKNPTQYMLLIVNVYFFHIIFILTRKNIIIINIPQSKYYVIILPYP